MWGLYLSRFSCCVKTRRIIPAHTYTCAHTERERETHRKIMLTYVRLIGTVYGPLSWRRKSLPTPVFWPGEFHGQYSPWGRKESDTTERPSCHVRLCHGPFWASQGVLVVKNLPANAGDIRDVDLIPGLGRSSGEEHGNPLQYSCLENPMDRGAGGLQSMGMQRVRHDYCYKRLSTQHTHGPFGDILCLIQVQDTLTMMMMLIIIIVN